MRSELPPRKKNWTPGTFQVGLFLRDEDGGTVEVVANKACPEFAEAVQNLFRTFPEMQRRYYGSVGSE